jgi:hypothetical protein
LFIASRIAVRSRSRCFFSPKPAHPMKKQQTIQSVIGQAKRGEFMTGSVPQP